MRCLLVIVLLLSVAASSKVAGRVLPLTTKDVCLMLRSGYSSESVGQELSARRLAGPLDAAAEKALADAGAAPALIDAIKGGSYAVAPADAQAAQDELAAQATRRARETEQLLKYNTLYQDQLARARASTPAQSQTPNLLAEQLRGDLVSLKSGSLGRVDDEPFVQKKFIALYFSAQWCGPCRKFTPQLIEFYNRVAPQHPEFDIVFFSNDRSPFGMETYMRESRMPWPAIDFAKLPGKGALKKYQGSGIPCLVVLDASGKVVSDTYVGTTRVGPEKVLADLDAILAGTPAAGIAASR